MVYGQQPTAFLQWAAEQNCATADGLGMLVEQAAASYRIWTTEQPANFAGVTGITTTTRTKVGSMSVPQGLILGILLLTLVFFIWGRCAMTLSHWVHYWHASLLG